MDNLRRIENTLEALINGQGNSIVIANQRGEIVEVNREFETQFGFKREEVLGQPISMIMPTRYIADHGAAFSRVRQDLSTGKYIGHTPASKLIAHGLCKNKTEKEVEIALETVVLLERIYFVANIKVLNSEN